MLLEVQDLDMKEYTMLLNGRIRLAKCIMQDSGNAEDLDVEVQKAMKELDLKPCGDPDSLISLKAFSEQVGTLKAAPTADILKSSEMKLSNAELQLHQLGKALESASTELQQAKRDKAARKTTMEKEEVARAKQAAKLEKKLAAAKAKQSAKENKQVARQGPGGEQLNGSSGLFSKAADFHPLPYSYPVDAELKMSDLDFSKPFVVLKPTMLEKLMASAPAVHLKSMIDLFESAFESSQPRKNSGRTHAKLKNAGLLVGEFEKYVGHLGKLKTLEPPDAVATRMAPAMRGIAKNKVSFGFDFAGMPTLRFQVGPMCGWPTKCQCLVRRFPGQDPPGKHRFQQALACNRMCEIQARSVEMGQPGNLILAHASFVRHI